MSAKDGRIVLPGGMSYRVLVLPPDDMMTPELVSKLRELVRGGATVCAPRPRRSPSLKGYPACDAEVRRLADTLWDASEAGERAVGEGRMIWGKGLDEVLGQLRVPPDFEARNAEGDTRTVWIHRRTDDADIYFVSNQRRRAEELDCLFRVTGKRPELWHPDTGRVEFAPVWEERGERTRVQLRLDGAGSVFIVFRNPAAEGRDHLVRVERSGPPVLVREPDELVIAKAVYGDFADGGEGWADITRKVKRVVQAGRLGVTATNAFAGGDPARNVVKELRVDFAIGGVRRTRVVREGATLELPEGAQVVRAIYGVIPDESELKERTVDITERLARHVKEGRLNVRVTNDLAGTDPAYLTVKELRVEYLLNGEPGSATARENSQLVLPQGGLDAPPPPAFELSASEDGATRLRAFAAGGFEFTWDPGKTNALEVGPPPAPVELAGPWEVRFEPGRGAPERATFDDLVSWTERPEEGVKHFSGTATYAKTIEIPPERLEGDRSLLLDLGRVEVIAEVRLNGAELGLLWKPPFRVDVTGAARAGPNALEVGVTNLWPNRLIGDARLPDDVDWSGRRPSGWPEWLVEGRERASPRVTFTTWRHYFGDEPLLDSGLIGPVRLFSAETVAVAPSRQP
jgi:hypothetical protein